MSSVSQYPKIERLIRLNSFYFGTNKNQKRNKSETKVKIIPLPDSQDRHKFLKKLAISSHFNMRYRGLFEYYGDDLIEYKQQDIEDDKRNKFLTIFSSYITTYLEDDMPPSWQQCNSSFVERLIYLYLPYSLKISYGKKEIEIFVHELKKFCLWLDQRKNTSFSEHLKSCSYDIHGLIDCEHLLNHLTLKMFPHYYQPNWNYKEDSKNLKRKEASCQRLEDGIFQITQINQGIIMLTDIHTNHSYQVAGLPTEKFISTGMLLHGIMGIKEKELYWDWISTLGVYPEKAKRYFVFIR